MVNKVILCHKGLYCVTFILSAICKRMQNAVENLSAVFWVVAPWDLFVVANRALNS